MSKLARLILPPAVILAIGLAQAPAYAQFGGLGGFGGGDMMSDMAPMIGMMKKRMGERRFAQLMQTVGPMAAQMMSQGGGFNVGGYGGGFGGGIGGFDAGAVPQFISPGMIRQMVALGGGGGRKGRSKKARRVR